MKLTNRGLHLFVCLRRGAGFLGMRNNARIGCMLQRAEECVCVCGGGGGGWRGGRVRESGKGEGVR